MLTLLNRRTLAVSVLLIIPTVYSISIANSPRYKSLINSDYEQFNYNHVNNYIYTYGYKSSSYIHLTMETETSSLHTPPNDNEGEVLFHDTIQRVNSNSITSAVASLDNNSTTS
jgi:hypothetical protein